MKQKDVTNEMERVFKENGVGNQTHNAVNLQCFVSKTETILVLEMKARRKRLIEATLFKLNCAVSTMKHADRVMGKKWPQYTRRTDQLYVY